MYTLHMHSGGSALRLQRFCCTQLIISSLCNLNSCCTGVPHHHILWVSVLEDQQLISVRAFVFNLAQLTCQKSFDCRNAIIRSSETFLDTSYRQNVVAVFYVRHHLYTYPTSQKGKAKTREKHT